MGTFQSARSLDLVSTEYFSIRHHDPLEGFGNHPFLQGADEHLGLRAPILIKAMLRPDFAETVGLCFVMAYHDDGKTLPEPSVHLFHEVLPLRFHDMHFGANSAHRTIMAHGFHLGVEQAPTLFLGETECMRIPGQRTGGFQRVVVE